MDAADLPQTVQALTDAYSRRELSPVEVTEVLLRRARDSQPTINAFIAITAEQAMEQARAAERMLARGGRTPLLGIPVTLKDLFDQHGVPTTAGSSLRRDAFAEADAPVVRRMFEAGAISLGKTNLHECAYGITNDNPHFGAVHNPWDRTRIPGGSSGGAGAAVAAGIGPVAMGSDTGGSIRIPAALCGVVGLKPTYGRVPKAGVFPLSASLDHAGPLARTVADAASTLECIAGPSPDDPTSAARPVDRYTEALGRQIGGLRVGVIEQHMRDLAPEVGAAVEAAIGALSRLGAHVRRVSWPDYDDVRPAQSAIQYAEASAVHRASLEAHPEAYGDDVRQRLQEGLAVLAVDYIAAFEKQRRLKASIADLLREVDVLAGPTVPIPAQPIGQLTLVFNGAETTVRAQLTRFTWPYNITGLPAISVPCGFTSEGLPIGLQLGTRAFEEMTLLQAAHAYEQATEWHVRRP